jgi:peptidoglycan/xylan/chitin deacetylase (PgdA/CDA1 family)
MNKKVILYLTISISVIVSAYGQKKQVCFSVDDLPTVTYGISDSAFHQEVINKLITSFRKHTIPAIGFVNEVKLYRDGDQRKPIPFQVNLLNRWVEAGLELGNHTFSHPDYNSTTLSEYSQNILKGELITRELLTRNGKSLTYFRHPFLHTGNSKEKSDSLNLFLAEHTYEVAPVTIDNEDYLFALAYHRANHKKDVNLVKQIKADYVHYMEQKLHYFERQAQRLFGRDIKQILLLHASLLNADAMDSLASMFVRNGYEFISMEEALKDKAYATEITRYGNWGISWLDRWALSQGKKGDFFEGDPTTPDYIKKMTE